MNDLSIRLLSIGCLLVAGCTANLVGRIDSYPNASAMKVAPKTRCLSAHLENRKVAIPLPVVTTSPTGTTTSSTARVERTQTVSVCDRYAPTTGPKYVEPGRTSDGVALGIMAGYAAFDATPKTGGLSPIHASGVASSLYADFGVSRAGLGAVAFEGGFNTYDIGSSNNLEGPYVGLHVSAYTSLVEPYVGVGYAWSGITSDNAGRIEAQIYLLKAGVLRHIRRAHHDLLVRVEAQWLGGASDTGYGVSGFAALATLGWYLGF